MNKPIPLEIAKGVAAWWRKQGDTAHVKVDNGDRSQNGMVLQGLASLLHHGAPVVTKEMWDAFEVALAARVADPSKLRSTVSCDYDPDMHLLDAAREAGFPERRVRGSGYGGVFPIKSVTWAYPAYAVGACGYGAPREVIAGVKPWEATTKVLERRPGWWEEVHTSGDDNEEWSTECFTFGVRVDSQGVEAAKLAHDGAVDAVRRVIRCFEPKRFSVFGEDGDLKARGDLEGELRAKTRELFPGLVYQPHRANPDSK